MPARQFCAFASNGRLGVSFGGFRRLRAKPLRTYTIFQAESSIAILCSAVSTSARELRHK